MLKSMIAAGVIAGSVLAAGIPAHAQGIMIGPDGVRVVAPEDQVERPARRGEARGEISERDAVRIARAEGLREVEDVRRTRNSYRVEGYDRRGDDIRVDVDRRDGAVIDVR
ncbi:PepSY domain-containing protein [Aureimonas frigidaquae]|uniref:PepSY domain-containing protein n=1 Tax=Aureimonas frigidaquae TaxID=424757 RepID=UPI000782FBA6|nr:PepSY domain-containing protein [Aureimonas frigidaquae]